jgi:cobalt-zinc-cadmium resistance protein CzcA
MNASISTFGLILLLFATDPGSEIQYSLVIRMIGGLVTSTLLTLILLPILYRRSGENLTIFLFWQTFSIKQQHGADGGLK